MVRIRCPGEARAGYKKCAILVQQPLGFFTQKLALGNGGYFMRRIFEAPRLKAEATLAVLTQTPAVSG